MTWSCWDCDWMGETPEQGREPVGAFEDVDIDLCPKCGSAVTEAKPASVPSFRCGVCGMDTSDPEHRAWMCDYARAAR